MPLETVYSAEEGVVERARLEDGRYRLELVPYRQDLYIPCRNCETSFPPDLIQYVAKRIPFAWICDIIARHEDPSYVAAALEHQLFAYFPAGAFRGKRLLDFGCGSGASTFALARALPQTEVVGVELDPNSIEIAERIANHRRMPNAGFLRSPSPDALPEGMGAFDFVMLSAVYEHLLPAERKAVMPLLWRILKPGGAIFVNQTPHRYFPYEHHSTMLWFVNYMPDRMAHWFARKYARHDPKVTRTATWNDLLRGGIRGGTEREIIRNLCGRSASGIILQPAQQGLKDRAGYWLSCTDPHRVRLLKRALAGVFRITDRLWGTVPSMNIDVVIRKTSKD
jgi:SAM-dependent methyltransferase